MTKVIEFLKERGIEFKIVDLPEEAFTVADVERMYGCSIDMIYKSLLFESGDVFVMAVVPGDKRVDTGKLEKASGVKGLKLAKPDVVKRVTDHDIGSQCPFSALGACFEVIKVVDSSIKAKEEINIGSGGDKKLGIDMKASEFMKVWDGKVEDIVE